MMHTKKRSLWLFVALTMVLSLALVLVQSASAVELGSDYITKMAFTAENGDSVDGTNVYRWQVFKYRVEFELPDNVVKQDDIITIHYPEQLNYETATPDFDIVATGTTDVIAKVHVDTNARTMTIKFTDYAEKHMDVKGFFEVSMSIREASVTSNEEVHLNFSAGSTNLLTVVVTTPEYPAPTDPNSKPPTDENKTFVHKDN